MHERARSNLFWKGMKQEIQHMVAECDTFQHHKGETTLLLDLLEPFPIPTRIWMYISMDFIEGLPKYGGKTTIVGAYFPSKPWLIILHKVPSV